VGRSKPEEQEEIRKKEKLIKQEREEKKNSLDKARSLSVTCI